jgi:hypothetical protein
MTAGCSWASRRGSRLQLALDPALELLERVERGLELSQLGTGAGPVDRPEQAQGLEPLDRDRGQLVARPFLDRGLPDA